MRPLAAKFAKQGWHFDLLLRVGDVALYEKRHPEVTAPSYEVVVVQKHEERVIAGKRIEASEAMPGAEQWGKAGWSPRTLADATKKFDEVCAARGSAS